jgi:hypothetical protein
MNGLLSREEMIRLELFSWDHEIPEQYRSRYREYLDQFVASMARAHRAWENFDATLQASEQRAHISSLIFGALSLHVMSTKLLVWGLLVPAGNTMRQVLEIMCMALLASKPRLGYLERYSSDRYSTTHAIRDALKNAEKLSLVPEALVTLQEARDFYNKFSHPTLLTIATYVEVGGNRTYIGASFDEGKQYAYAKKMSTRAQVAGLLNNVIEAICHNLDD